MRRVRILVMALVAVGLLLIAACSGSAPETVEFNLDIRDRALDQESPVIRVKNGDTVVLLITSDEAGTIHLHGYDLEDELGEEGVTRMEFVANLEGRFAMAVHPGSAGTRMTTPIPPVVLTLSPSPRVPNPQLYR